MQSGWGLGYSLKGYIDQPPSELSFGLLEERFVATRSSKQLLAASNTKQHQAAPSNKQQQHQSSKRKQPRGGRQPMNKLVC